MKAITDLEGQGYTVSLNGDRIRARRKRGSCPDIGKITVLTEEIKSRKDQAVRFLKQRDEDERQFAYQERAAIMEFDGALSREDAERQAVRRKGVNCEIIR
jgi:hypothetical protein